MTLDQVRAEIRRVARSDRPIIVGPWMSEVGFEVLYWIPFLRWAIATGQIPRERLWVLSRGGCRSWYADIASNYLELYDLYSPDELRRLNARRIREQAAQGSRAELRRGQVTAKQYCLSSIEDEIIRAASLRVGLAAPVILHPSVMYRAFRPAWRRRSHDVFSHWMQVTRPARLTAPAEAISLPDRYVAVKFYASEANPDHPTRRAQIQQIVRAITDVSDVVLLHTGTHFDEHGEFPIQEHPQVHRVPFEPSTNLDQQTAIVAGSSGFVGTYGGFAYLAPFLGISTLALYGVRNFRADHLRLMMDVAHRRLHSSFCVTDIADGLGVVKRERRHWMAHAA